MSARRGAGPKVLIADTSPLYKKLFEQAFIEAARNALVDYASGKDELLEKFAKAKYNVILLDASVAGMETAWLSREIRRAMPEAALLITALPSTRNETLIANAQGVRLIKPVYCSYQDNLVEIKRMIARVISDLANRGGETARRGGETEAAEHARPPANAPRPRFRPEIALIASSTGGPYALEIVLKGLSAAFPIPVLVVQHMLPTFTRTLAANLDKQAKLRVKVAESGEPILPGTVYIAPDGLHMTLNAQKRIAMNDGPPVLGIRPTADALFESVARVYPGGGVLAVVLTGMGRDGEKGLSRLKQNPNCYCLAQSRETCVVYGMPRAAVESGLADKVLDLNDIPAEMEAIARAPKRDGKELTDA